MQNLLKKPFANSSPLDSPLWIDRPDAAQLVSVADIPDEVRRAAMELITKGFAVVRSVQDPATCARVIDDYYEYSRQNRDYVNANLDEMGREKRLVNFHLWSENSMKLATNPRIMRILDYVFGGEAAVYTSLTFKFGTQQPVHRDTPHFATWPDGYFFGCWTALEDIASEAGPLFYYEGAHRFKVDVTALWERVQRENPQLTQQQALDLALDLYNGEVIERAPTQGAYRLTSMKRGDVAIWHPQMPHGGSTASDPMRSRWSTVFHCSPVEKQVHQHQSFFLHAGRDGPPARYGYRESGDRKVALAGDVAFM